MTEGRREYLMHEYQTAYWEYMREMYEYTRIEQGGGTFSMAARQKLLMRIATHLTNLYMRMCFLSLVLQ